jgi:hypothetical protein
MANHAFSGEPFRLRSPDHKGHEHALCLDEEGDPDFASVRPDDYIVHQRAAT